MSTPPRGRFPTLAAQGAEILVADYASEAVEGCAPSSVTVVVRFPSKEAARACYGSPEYSAIIGLRLDNTQGFAVLTDQFEMP